VELSSGWHGPGRPALLSVIARSSINLSGERLSGKLQTQDSGDYVQDVSAVARKVEILDLSLNDLLFKSAAVISSADEATGFI
jgi:hypothetical protein